jgi:hypothetical protein
VIACSLGGSAEDIKSGDPAKLPIASAHLGNAVACEGSRGDVWTTTWADDHQLYSVSDDTTGFDNACSSNLAVHSIVGETPPNLRGKTVNPMKQFGAWAEVNPGDGASWKASGLVSVDGVLYLSISRHHYPDERKPFAHFIQETWDASIIKSTDHGRNWSATPEIGKAMFPGRLFSNPFFVQHGKDGSGRTNNGGEYIYATSSDGVWNNGSEMILGRVRRDQIARLDARDWEFCHGFDEQQQPIWRARHDTALYTFHASGRASMTGIHYLEPLDIYIMPQWSYDYSKMAPADPGSRWKFTRFDFYQARAPWGPWSLFHHQDYDAEGFYNPGIPAKFISEDGRKLWIFTAGNPPDAKYYRLNMIPVELRLDV